VDGRFIAGDSPSCNENPVWRLENSLPVTITPRCPRCGMRLYAVRANRPGIGSSGDTALPFGYCWECEELFKVDVELEQLKPRKAESPPSNRAANPSRQRANGDTNNEDSARY